MTVSVSDYSLYVLEIAQESMHMYICICMCVYGFMYTCIWTNDTVYMDLCTHVYEQMIHTHIAKTSKEGTHKWRTM